MDEAQIKAHLAEYAARYPSLLTVGQAAEIAQRPLKTIYRWSSLRLEAAAASPSPWLFYAPDTVGKQTGRWRRGRIWARLKAAMKRAGVANGTTHTFRHVFCSFLANHGVSPYRIMKVMGHDSLDIVLMYCHATEAELIQAVLAAPFEAMLAGAAAEKGGGDVANS